MTKTIFFGTEKFAANILEAMINSQNFDIILVITQPDRPVGRKQEMQKPPVKIIAEKYNLKIDQPETLKEYNFPEGVDLSVVCEYGLIIPKKIVESPRYGSINVHPSLLPKYRGASPIQSTLIAGDTETGVSIMLMDEKMDHGPILSQEVVKIDNTDTYTTLTEKLLKTAISGLLEASQGYISGKISPKTQDDSQATFCTLFTKESGHVDWNKTKEEIYNLGRGLEVWPGLWTMLGEKRLKLLEIKPSTEKINLGKIKIIGPQIFVGCQNGSVEILKLQLEGGKPIDSKNFLNGFSNLLNNQHLA